MTIWNGITEQGAVVPIQVDAQGRVVVSGGGGVSSEVYGAAKAIAVVNSDGTAAYPPFNLTVSKQSEGLYSCSFINPLPDGNYAVIATCAQYFSKMVSASSQTSTGFFVSCWWDTGAAADGAFSVAVFNSYPSEVTPLILPTSTVAEVKALRAEVEKLKKAKTP